jgi:hypothetical protein
MQVSLNLASITQLTVVQWGFSGISTFAHLPHKRCLMEPDAFDIAILGAPFDNAVSYRPGKQRNKSCRVIFDAYYGPENTQTKNYQVLASDPEQSGPPRPGKRPFGDLTHARESIRTLLGPLSSIAAIYPSRRSITH